LWCKNKKKLVIEREKFVVVVFIANTEMGLISYWVIIGHGVGEVVVVEEAVEKKNERIGDF
jgi:hypothetical protein